MSKVNGEVGERHRHEKLEGKRRLVQTFQNYSVNVLGALYWKLPMGIKYTIFFQVPP